VTGYVLSRRARSDLVEIWNYTTDRWGVEQARRYAEILRGAMDANNPQLGRACDQVRPGYRKYAAGSHLLFYRLTPLDVHVVRILHRRMDAYRHL